MTSKDISRILHHTSALVNAACRAGEGIGRLCKKIRKGKVNQQEGRNEESNRQ